MDCMLKFGLQYYELFFFLCLKNGVYFIHFDFVVNHSVPTNPDVEASYAPMTVHASIFR